MPIYEYRCRDCGKRSSLLVLNVKNPPSPVCTHCQGSKPERIMSRFASPKSEEARLESLVDAGRFGDIDEQDPGSMAKFMKKMGQEMGEDVGDDVEEALAGSGDEDAETAATDIE